MHDLLRWGFEPSYMQWEFHGESSDKDVSSSDSDNNDFDVNLVKEWWCLSLLHALWHESIIRQDDVYLIIQFLVMNSQIRKLKGFIDCWKMLNKNYILDVKKIKIIFNVSLNLFQMKCHYWWTNTLFNSLLKLLIEALPESNVFVDSIYETWNTNKDLRLNYVKIDIYIMIILCMVEKSMKSLLNVLFVGKASDKNKNDIPNKIVLIVHYFLISNKDYSCQNIYNRLVK